MDQWHQGFYIGSMSTVAGVLFAVLLVAVIHRIFK